MLLNGDDNSLRPDYYSGLGADLLGSSDEEDDDSDDESGSSLDLADEDIPVTGFAVASNKRNADFHELFPTVPEGDYLIEGEFLPSLHTLLVLSVFSHRGWHDVYSCWLGGYQNAYLIVRLCFIFASFLDGVIVFKTNHRLGLADYGCALQREILIQGRIYISENHICFHANIFGWITDVSRLSSP